jgi:hypothetical protein
MRKVIPLLLIAAILGACSIVVNVGTQPTPTAAFAQIPTPLPTIDATFYGASAYRAFVTDFAQESAALVQAMRDVGSAQRVVALPDMIAEYRSLLDEFNHVRPANVSPPAYMQQLVVISTFDVGIDHLESYANLGLYGDLQSFEHQMDLGAAQLQELQQMIAP